MLFVNKGLCFCTHWFNKPCLDKIWFNGMGEPDRIPLAFPTVLMGETNTDSILVKPLINLVYSKQCQGYLPMLNAMQSRQPRLLVHSVRHLYTYPWCTAGVKLALHQWASVAWVAGFSRHLCQSHLTSFCIALPQVHPGPVPASPLLTHKQSKVFPSEMVPIYLLAVLQAFKLLGGQELRIKQWELTHHFWPAVPASFSPMHYHIPW